VPTIDLKQPDPDMAMGSSQSFTLTKKYDCTILPLQKVYLFIERELLDLVKSEAATVI
jgi:hypothetical protein